MKKTIYTCLFLMMIVFVSFGNVASANEINDIDIHIEINKDGSVDVTEKRTQDMDEGTENYIVFNDEDMQDSEITDYSVSGLKKVDNWDSDASLEEKAGKFGMLDTDDGKELVWGIGEYGEQEYEVSYTLSNVVHDMTDGQSLYWDFNTFSDLDTDHMKMTVSTYEPFTKDTVKFWGFGTKGYLDLEDGNLVWTSDKALDSSNYATLLLQFDEGMYNTSVIDNKSLKDQQEMALHNSNYEDSYLDHSGSTDGPKASLAARVFGWIAGIIGGAIVLVVTVWLIIVGKISGRKKKENNHIQSPSKLKAQNAGKTMDTPPKVEDFAGIAFILKHLNMAYFEQFIEVYLIKWNKEERIKLEYENDHKKLNKRDTTIKILDYKTQYEKYGVYFKEAVKQVEADTYNGDYELLLWIMFVDAMDETGTITNRQLNKWFKKHAKQITTIADYLEEYSDDYLDENNIIHCKQDTAAFFTISIKTPTEAGEELIDHIIQYDNYLENESEASWKARVESDAFTVEEIIWSILLGHHEEVTKRFEKYKFNHPNQNGDFYYYPTYFYLSSNTTTNINAGLSSGGFSSNAASGSGGATGVSGGAGAGGGGGGGAR